MSYSKSPISYAVDDEALYFMNASEAARSPEERLLLSMLERAIRDYIGGNAEEKADAEFWFSAQLDGSWEDVGSFEPFSFAWVCETLGLQRENVLARLKHAAQLSKEGVLPFFLDKRFVSGGRATPPKANKRQEGCCAE